MRRRIRSYVWKLLPNQEHRSWAYSILWIVVAILIMVIAAHIPISNMYVNRDFVGYCVFCGVLGSTTINLLVVDFLEGERE